VIVTQFGASPAELEAQVTKTVEDATAAIAGVQHIDSNVIDGPPPPPDGPSPPGAAKAAAAG
jgi:hypothetical protein